MKTTEKTNGSQTLVGALARGHVASDGNVSNGNPDELSSLPEEFSGMYRACYEAGYASGKEAGYRQGYQAGFEDGRRQGGDGISAAPAAVENNAGNGARGTPKARLFGLPCTNCGSWFFSDEASCPRCSTPRASTPGAVATELPH